MWQLENNKLGISVHSQNIDGLINELEAQIDMLKQEYISAPDDILTNCAKKLKTALKKHFKE